MNDTSPLVHGHDGWNILDGLLEGCMVIDRDWRYAYLNDAAARHGHAEKESLIGRTLFEAYPGVEKSEVFAAYKKCMEERTAEHKEMSYAFPDGSVEWYEFSINPIPEGIFVLSVETTERKRAEEAAHVSEEKFSAAFNASPDLVAITRVSDGKILEVNESYSRMLGYSRDESVGKTTAELSIWADAADRERFVAALERDGQVIDFETTLRRKDGTAVMVTDSARVFDLQGERYILSTAHDITDRKQAERELRLFRTLLDSSTDGIEVMDPDTLAFVDVNEAECRELGYSREELLSMRATDIDPAMDEEQKSMIDAQVRKAGKAKFETEHRRKDGTAFPVEISATLVELDKPYILSIVRDITERKAEEKALRESAEELRKYKMAVEAASDHIILTDREGTILYVNKNTESFTGYKREELLGKTASMWGGQMSEEFYDEMWKTLREEKKPFSAEVVNRRKDGRLYDAEIHVSPVLDESGEVLYFIGVERDITKAKEIDTAKSEFISLASHQMRTPLTAINWYSEMLLGGDAGELNAKQKEYFEAIYGASQQINEIIKTFLHILRLETGSVAMNPVPVDLGEMVRLTVGESKLPIEKKRLRVREQLQEALPPLKIDPELLRVILQNLISNAVKYTPDDGEVAISVEDVARGGVVAGKTAEEGSVLVSVRDTGIGIPETDRNKIFTKFFRAGNAKAWDPNGNGLGLYMANRMIHTAKGTLWFASEEGKGTTFYALLPREEP